MELLRVRRPNGPQDWDTQRDIITDLYITQGLELEDLMKTMERDHFFKATKKQYKTYFTTWDLRKNIRSSEYNAIIKKKREREKEGKDSAFRLRGALVDDSKIVRYEKRTKTGDEDEIAEAGTPKELSCFTPSPVASSPIVPSLDPPDFTYPNLLWNSLVSPSEQALLAPNAVSSDLPYLQSPCLLPSSIASTSEKTLSAPSLSLVSPENPSHEGNLTFSQFTMVLVDQMASWKSVKIDILSKNSRRSKIFTKSKYFRGEQCMDDIIRVAKCQPYGPSEGEFSSFRSLSSLPRLGSCFMEYAGERVMFSGRSALFYFVLLRFLYDIGFVSGSVTRLQPASTDSGTQNLSDSLRISNITTARGVCSSASGFELSVTGLGRDTVVKFSIMISLDLEQKHNPDGRRRDSFESIRSLDSFLSDPVVDWKELLHGYNQ